MTIKQPDGRAMILDLGKAAQTAFVHLVDGAETFQQVDLVYDMGKGSQTITDNSFPWEFTVPLAADTDQFSFTLSSVMKDGKRLNSAVEHLTKKAGE